MGARKLTAAALQRQLKALGDADTARHSQRFFKTGPGEYGEGDVFVGVRVPVVRKLAKQFSELSLDQVTKALASPLHEVRLCALIILVGQFSRGGEAEQGRIYRLYLDSTQRINNWDLVDASAHKIVGPWLARRPRKPLYKLARSNNLWERRIAIMSTFHFIRQSDFDETLAIAELLLADGEDLIHKAVGWMLREVGNRDRKTELGFLNEHGSKMPRTMLRYAIEKFPEADRQRFLAR